MMDKELTLMICNHNHGRYLPRMLEDVFAQTLDPSKWKMLIIFDECNDNSELIFANAWNDLCTIQGKKKDWLECNVKVREKKQNLAACKNYGLDFVDTEYICYLDADDGMLPNRLELQLDTIKNNDLLDVVFCQAFDIDNHNRLLINCFSIGQYQSHQQIVDRIYQENVLCHGSCLAKTQAFRDVGGYDESSNILGREDHDLWVRMICAGKKFLNIPERLYLYRLNSSSNR